MNANLNPRNLLLMLLGLFLPLCSIALSLAGLEVTVLSLPLALPLVIAALGCFLTGFSAEWHNHAARSSKNPDVPQDRKDKE